jgi:hypothetical protein
MTTQDTATELLIEKSQQVADLLNTLREIYWLTAETKRSHIANIIGCKAIDAINKHAKTEPIQLTGWTRMA